MINAINWEKTGKHIASELSRQNITPSQIAAFVGCSEKTVSGWLLGKKMQTKHAFCISQILGVSLDSLFIKTEGYEEYAKGFRSKYTKGE